MTAESQTLEQDCKLHCSSEKRCFTIYMMSSEFIFLFCFFFNIFSVVTSDYDEQGEIGIFFSISYTTLFIGIILDALNIKISSVSRINSNAKIYALIFPEIIMAKVLFFSGIISSCILFENSLFQYIDVKVSDDFVFIIYTLIIAIYPLSSILFLIYIKIDNMKYVNRYSKINQVVEA